MEIQSAAAACLILTWHVPATWSHQNLTVRWGSDSNPNRIPNPGTAASSHRDSPWHAPTRRNRPSLNRSDRHGDPPCQSRRRRQGGNLLLTIGGKHAVPPPAGEGSGQRMLKHDFPPLAGEPEGSPASLLLRRRQRHAEERRVVSVSGGRRGRREGYSV